VKVHGDWIDAPGAQAVCAALTVGGHQAFFVGGCVRNALMGLPVADVDIATDATPERVVDLAQAAGLRPVPTGIAHGTITVVADGAPHEVTTFRRDVETFGRHARVAFTAALEEDAARRDFTMNALYARADGTVIDPLGGLADVMARRLRFVGQPQDRIAEDALRILRFFRFSAWYADTTLGHDPEALAAIAAGIDGLAQVSAERIGQEMRKLLSAPDPAPAVAAMQATGVLARVLPGADARALAPLVHLEGSHPPAWLRRVLVLGGQTDGLRLSRAEALALEHLRAALAMEVHEAAYRHGAQTATDAALAMAALTGNPLGDDTAAQIATAASARFPLAAADLMPGLQGAALGAALKRLEADWIASGFTLDRAALLARV